MALAAPQIGRADEFSDIKKYITKWERFAEDPTELTMAGKKRLEQADLAAAKAKEDRERAFASRAATNLAQQRIMGGGTGAGQLERAQQGQRRSSLFSDLASQEQLARSKADIEASDWRGQQENQQRALAGTLQAQTNFGEMAQKAREQQKMLDFRAQQAAALEAAEKRRAKKSLWGSLAGAAGMGIGAAFGGPLGASIGGAVGQGLGQSLG